MARWSELTKRLLGYQARQNTEQPHKIQWELVCSPICGAVFFRVRWVCGQRRNAPACAIHQLQLAPQRHAMGDARGDQAFVGQQLGNVVCGRLAFHRRVGGQDHFGKSALCFDARHQLRNADGFRAQAVQRRQMALEHEVAAAVAGLLHRVHIHRPFHHAQQRVVAARVGALRTEFFFGQRAALAAVTHTGHGLAQGLGQPGAAATITLQQLQRHTLGGFLADTWQSAQGVDQLANQGAEAHGRRVRQNNETRFIPAPRISVKCARPTCRSCVLPVDR